MADTPQHVAIIMDGNGRWARSRGMPRPAGHRASVKVVRRVVEECIQPQHPLPHLVRLLERELAAPARRGRLAHEAVPRVAGARGVGSAPKSACACGSSAIAACSEPRSRAPWRRPRRSPRAIPGSCSASRSPTAAAGTSLRPAARSPARSPQALCGRTRSTRRTSRRGSRSPAFRTRICSSAPAGSCASAISCCGISRMPSCISPTCCFRTSARRESRRGARVLRAARAALRQDLGADRREGRCLSCASSRRASSAACCSPACSCSIPTGRCSPSASC